MTLDIDGAEAFVALVRHEHFGHAAAELHVGTPGLSKRLARFEQAVGAVLVVRGPSGYAGLTLAGQRLLPEAKRLLAVAGSLRRGDFAEHVRVGVPGGVNDHLSVPQWKVVAAMVARYACGARLSVVGVPFGADETWLTDERVDVMLGVLEPRVAHLDEAPIASCKRVLVVACEHPLVEKGYADIDDLKGAHILVESLADERWMSPWLLGDVEPTPAWTTYPLRGTTIAPLKPPVQAGECIVIAAEVCTPWLLGELAVLPLAVGRRS